MIAAVQGMVRDFTRWEKLDPKAVAAGSEAQIIYALEDAKKDIAALKAAVRSLESKREWQPIETAPKDRDVLLARVVVEDGEVRSHVSQGRWIDGEEDQSDQPGHDAGFVDCDYGCFFPGRSFGSEKYRYEAKQPTHWMPLPAAPARAVIAKEAGHAECEPKYVVQTVQNPDDHVQWFSDHAFKARDEGCTHARFSVHPHDERMALVEAWVTRPDDEGAQRWQFEAKEVGQ